MKVRIKKKLYDFQFDSLLGAHYLFEKTTGHVYNGGSVYDLYVLFYAILTLANDGMTLSFDEFCQSLNDKNLLDRIQTYYINRLQALSDVAASENGEQPDDEDDGKKKD